ncbi:MAG: hypothetical protein KDD82_05105 [Planctomycetes bacterium]|nr:hypothetical protein [Planctomycetota bacterium]
MERERLPIKVELPRCPFCHEDVAADEPKRGCEACFAWHHAECWDEGRGRCSACGVAPDVSAPEPATAAPQAPSRDRPRRPWIRRWRSQAAGESLSDDALRRGPVGLGGDSLRVGDQAPQLAAIVGIVAAFVSLGWTWEHLGVLPIVGLLSLIALGVVFLVITPGGEGRLWRRRRRRRRRRGKELGKPSEAGGLAAPDAPAEPAPQPKADPPK